MTKEESLELLKWLILQLRDHSKELKENPMLMADWRAKYKYLNGELQKANPCDALWIGDEYESWHKKEMHPHFAKVIDPSLLK